MNRFERQNISAHRNLEDFESRKSFDPANVFKVKGFDWEYVAVHPVADEDWWFEKFGESPEICVAADFYWKFAGDVAFLEISTPYSEKRFGQKVERGFFARWRSDMLYLWAVVEDDLIYFRTVETVMKTFWAFHLEENLFQKYHLKRKTRKL